MLSGGEPAFDVVSNKTKPPRAKCEVAEYEISGMNQTNVVACKDL